MQIASIPHNFQSLNFPWIVHQNQNFELPIVPYNLLSDLARLFHDFIHQWKNSNLSVKLSPVSHFFLHCFIPFLFLLLISTFLFQTFYPQLLLISEMAQVYFFSLVSSTTYLFHQSQNSNISIFFLFCYFLFFLFFYFDLII